MRATYERRIARPSLAAVVAAASCAVAAAQTHVTFRDVTAAAGIRFERNSGFSENKWYPELFGGGAAVLDIDSDGWPDLLLVNGRDWQSPAGGSRHGLYRNNRDGTFTDIAAGSGLDAVVYGMGASVGDYDNDGRDDVYITAIEGDRLYRNEGQGRFRDVTEQAGIRNRDFAVSSAWLDYDRDGHLDLFVGNYVTWSPETETRCSSDGRVRGYCGPDAYKGTVSRLYRNLGDGTFADVTSQAGLDDPGNKVMGVAVLDYQMDGWPDLFVGNDRVPAKLYRNTGEGRFVEEGLKAGVALNEHGAARGNMGVDAADYDRSGWPDILVGNFFFEMLGLYQNQEGWSFVDRAPRTTVGRASLMAVTWGAFFFDYDLDGHLDIFAANGGTDESQAMLNERARMDQPPLLLRNRGDSSFEDVTASVGADFGRPIRARGAAYLDFDRDGDLDIVMSANSGRAYLLRNDRQNGHNWLRVRTVGSKSNRSGIGAVVRVTSASGTQWQMVRSGSSYASQSELTLTFGLATDSRVAVLELEWPSGVKQRFTNLAPNQLVVVNEDGGLTQGVD